MLISIYSSHSFTEPIFCFLQILLSGWASIFSIPLKHLISINFTFSLSYFSDDLSNGYSEAQTNKQTVKIHATSCQSQVYFRYVHCTRGNRADGKSAFPALVINGCTRVSFVNISKQMHHERDTACLYLHLSVRPTIHPSTIKQTFSNPDR